MINHSRHLALLAMIAAGLLPVTSAQAQYYRSSNAQPAPLYPYAVQADRALIEKLRKRAPVKRTVINTRKIARDAPVVVETRRVVDDPPRVIERRHIVEDQPVRARRKPAAVKDRDNKKHAGRDDSKKRVIQADAEITIHGPDRMSIRLFRKGQGPKANARAE
jgi:hypothetical protein